MRFCCLYFLVALPQSLAKPLPQTAADPSLYQPSHTWSSAVGAAVDLPYSGISGMNSDSQIGHFGTPLDESITGSDRLEPAIESDLAQNLCLPKRTEGDSELHSRESSCKTVDSTESNEETTNQGENPKEDTKTNGVPSKNTVQEQKEKRICPPAQGHRVCCLGPEQNKFNEVVWVLVNRCKTCMFLPSTRLWVLKASF